MEQTNSLAEIGISEASSHRDRSRKLRIPQSIAEEDQQHNNSQHIPIIETGCEGPSSAAVAFIDSIKSFFAPCVGVVDAASLFIGECRSSKYGTYDTNQQGGVDDKTKKKNSNTNTNNAVANDVIMRLRERNGAFGYHQGVKHQNRSKTLDIPTDGILFDDDDVSAISAHTLEEMERLRIAQIKGFASFHLSPPSNRKYGKRQQQQKSLQSSSNNTSIRSNNLRQHPRQQSTRSHHTTNTFGPFLNNMASTFSSQIGKDAVSNDDDYNYEESASICVSTSESSSGSDGIIAQRRPKKNIHRSSHIPLNDNGYTTHVHRVG